MGRYFRSLLLSFLLLIGASKGLWAKVVVISDIDDTVKETNNMARLGVIYHFLKGDVFWATRDLYQEVKTLYESRGEEVEFFYVSAGYRLIFNADKWIEKKGLPAGETFLRRLRSGHTYEFKYRTIHEILSKQEDLEDVKVLFFGDNSSKDPLVYSDIVRDFALSDASIFIRDVSTEATFPPFTRLENVHYFFSEKDLFAAPALQNVTAKWRGSVVSGLQKRTLIPYYTFRTLAKRTRKALGCNLRRGFGLFKCLRAAKHKSIWLWENYHRGGGPLMVEALR